MQGRLKQGLLWGMGLTLLAVAGGCLVAVLASGAPERQAVPSPSGTGPVTSTVQSAPSVPLSSPAFAVRPALKEGQAASETAGSGLLARPALDWYRAALVPTASVRDRTIALRINILCAQVRSAKASFETQRAASSRPAVASAPGVSAQELDELNMRTAKAAPPEQGVELQKLSDYCAPGEGFELARALRKAGTRPIEYFELALPDRPLAGRFPVVVGVLGNPGANAPEFAIWADRGLRDVLERGHGLNDLQAWHASAWILREVLGGTEEVALFDRTQCAVYGHCRSAKLLTDADRQRAEAAARQVLQDLQRQDWPRLVYGPQP